MNCNVCDKPIHLLHKLFFNQFVGLECAYCHSILAHKKRNVVLGLSAMVVSLCLFIVALNHGGLVFWGAALISCTALIWHQLAASLRVVYENTHHQ